MEMFAMLSSGMVRENGLGASLLTMAEAFEPDVIETLVTLEGELNRLRDEKMRQESERRRMG